MNLQKFRKKPITYVIILTLTFLLLYLFSNWADFKAGLLGKQPIELSASK